MEPELLASRTSCCNCYLPLPTNRGGELRSRFLGTVGPFCVECFANMGEAVLHIVRSAIDEGETKMKAKG